MLRSLLLLALLGGLVLPARAQHIKKRIAVLPVSANESVTTRSARARDGTRERTTEHYIPPPDEFARGLTEMLTTALVNTGRFVVLERVALADLEAEHERTEAGLLAEGTGARAGNVLGAQVFVRAAVTGYTYDRAESGGTARLLKGIKALEGVGVSRTVEKASVVLDVRLYDAETSQVLAAQHAEGLARGTSTSVDVAKDAGEFAAAGFGSTPLGEASRDALAQVVDFVLSEMEELPWEGRIAAIDLAEAGQPALFYINAGSDLGLQPGMRLTVYKAGRPIVDPETRAVIGRTRDRAVGACEVVEVTPGLAMATPLGEAPFSEGDVVRVSEGGE